MSHWRLYAQAASRLARPPTRAPGWALPAAALAWLRARIRGSIVLPGDADYAAMRAGFNPRYDPHPVAVLLPADEADLAAILALARRIGAPLAVRGGGHGFNGRANTEGLVIDMRRFDAIAIAGDTAVVGAGARQGAVRDALAAAGRHVSLGDSAEVGIAGFMQGGGYGHDTRLFGMNCDQVLAVRVMLADGRVVRADHEANRDLFWAVRGGAGGGFGVVTEITYRTIAAPRLAEDSLCWGLHTAAERAVGAAVLARIEAEFTGAGRTETALTAMVVQGRGDHPGPYLIVDAVHRGNAAGLARDLAGLRALGPLEGGFDDAWGAIHGAHPAVAVAGRYVGRALGEAGWRVVLDVLHRGRGAQAVMTVHPHGGAIDAVRREACAFVHRTPLCLLSLNLFWNDPAEEAVAVAYQAVWAAAVAPYWNGRVYANFPGDELADYRGAYWGEAFPALLAVRRKYDPGMLFAGRQDVSPDPDRKAPPALWPPEVADALRLPVEV